MVLGSLGQARAKAADAAIIEDLIGIRTSAESYFQENGDYGYYPRNGDSDRNDRVCLLNNFGYLGVTKLSAAVVAAIQHAKTLNDGTARCASNPKSYAVALKLKTPTTAGGLCAKYYCVDSNGTPKLIQNNTGHLSNNFTNQIIVGFYDTVFSCGVTNC